MSTVTNEEPPMSSLIIEEESGTYQPMREHPHRGYWAGSFTAPAELAVLEGWFAWGRAQIQVNAPR
jgi:hypothetical protein